MLWFMVVKILLVSAAMRALSDNKHTYAVHGGLPAWHVWLGFTIIAAKLTYSYIADPIIALHIGVPKCHTLYR